MIEGYCFRCNFGLSNDDDTLIYNSDGKEAKMCGNAASCVASLLFASKSTNSISIETISVSITANLNKNGEISTSIDLPPQTFLKTLDVNNVNINNLNFSEVHPALKSGTLVNMGNPHIVFIVNNIDDINLSNYGKKITTFISKKF